MAEIRPRRAKTASNAPLGRQDSPKQSRAGAMFQKRLQTVKTVEKEQISPEKRLQPPQMGSNRNAQNPIDAPILRLDCFRTNTTYITERCVLRLLPEGLTVTETAPGINLERDVLGQTDVRLRVSERLRKMDPGLFDPDSFEPRLQPD